MSKKQVKEELKKAKTLEDIDRVLDKADYKTRTQVLPVTIKTIKRIIGKRAG